MLLALLGGGLGLLVARLGVELLMKFRPTDNAQFWSSYTRTFDFFRVELDWRVLGFNFAVTILTGYYSDCCRHFKLSSPTSVEG
jgi:hypothetical protein